MPTEGDFHNSEVEDGQKQNSLCAYERKLFNDIDLESTRLSKSSGQSRAGRNSGRDTKYPPDL